MRFMIRAVSIFFLGAVVSVAFLTGAQAGAEHGGGGHVASGHVGAARGFSAPAPFYGISGPPPLGASGFIGPSPVPSGRNFGRLGTFNTFRGGRNGYYNRRLPFAYFFAPYYYPFLDYDTGGYDYPPNDASQDANAQGALMAENALGEQIQRLSAEVEQLKSNQQPMPPAYPTPSSPSQEPQTPASPPITLVLRSGQQLQVQNYAVMDHVFWDFTKEPARKIPISSIDIGASAKATEARGAEFPQLSAQ
jgi:hypothetical protein